MIIYFKASFEDINGDRVSDGQNKQNSPSFQRISTQEKLN